MSRSSRWRRSSVYLDVSNIDALPGQPAQQRRWTYYSSCTSNSTSGGCIEPCQTRQMESGALFGPKRTTRHMQHDIRENTSKWEEYQSSPHSRDALSCAWPPPCPGLPAWDPTSLTSCPAKRTSKTPVNILYGYSNKYTRTPCHHRPARTSERLASYIQYKVTQQESGNPRTSVSRPCANSLFFSLTRKSLLHPAGGAETGLLFGCCQSREKGPPRGPGSKPACMRVLERAPHTHTHTFTLVCCSKRAELSR